MRVMSAVVRSQGDVDHERLKRQQELTALNLYQLQQLQYQYLLR